MDDVAERTARRERSERVLKDRGVHVNPHLPGIETAHEARIRTPQEVAERCVVLLTVAGWGHRAGAGIVANLRNAGLWEKASVQEQEFLSDANAPQRKYQEATWRVESVHTLLWALNLIESLEWPDSLCDVPFLQSTVPWEPSKIPAFVDSVRLRPVEEILDASDFIYCAHWAVVDARLFNKAIPGDLHPDVVYERHYALNWLTCTAEDWDDISTDT